MRYPEIIEYAIWLGMDPVAETNLLWIAREGIKVMGPCLCLVRVCA